MLRGVFSNNSSTYADYFLGDGPGRGLGHERLGSMRHFLLPPAITTGLAPLNIPTRYLDWVLFAFDDEVGMILTS